MVRQGDRGDKFYIIRGGTVVVTKRDGDGTERRVGSLGRGQYFGEQALLHEDRRLATVTAQPPGVECLTLERGYVCTRQWSHDSLVVLVSAGVGVPTKLKLRPLSILADLYCVSVVTFINKEGERKTN